jgi:hypothetical protein
MKTYVKHLNCKLYYQQLHLKYLCNLTRYWLQAPWGWHESVETCRNVITCEIIVHLLVIGQNNKRCMVHILKLKKKSKILLTGARRAVESFFFFKEWLTCFSTVSSRLLLARKKKSFLRAFANFRKGLLASSCMSGRMQKLGSYWKDFRGFIFEDIFRKSVEKIQMSLKYDNSGYFTWRPIHICGNIFTFMCPCIVRIF